MAASVDSVSVFSQGKETVYDSIQSLYEMFAVFRKPADFPACECCWSNAEKEDLLKRDLAELSEEELSMYAADVFFTVGSVADFKYFLPRILELSVNDQFIWPDPEVVLAKLRLADWNDWPEHERAAVLRVLEEKFVSLLHDEGSDGQAIDSWICALGRSVSDITPYLDQLLEKGAKVHLMNFIEWNYSYLLKGELANPFWADASDNRRRVLAWLNRAEVKRLLNDNPVS
jgi:hypothetical protein